MLDFIDRAYTQGRVDREKEMMEKYWREWSTSINVHDLKSPIATLVENIGKSLESEAV
jgi:hypothetical protein